MTSRSRRMGIAMISALALMTASCTGGASIASTATIEVTVAPSAPGITASPSKDRTGPPASQLGLG